MGLHNVERIKGLHLRQDSQEYKDTQQNVCKEFLMCRHAHCSNVESRSHDCHYNQCDIMIGKNCPI